MDNYSFIQWTNRQDQIRDFNWNKRSFDRDDLDLCTVETMRYAESYFKQERTYTRLSGSGSHVWTYQAANGIYFRVDERIAQALENKWIYSRNRLDCVIA